MNFIKSIVLLMTIAYTITGCDAKINNPKTETVKVYGNCNMCKKRIEKAIRLSNNAKGEWNADSKMLTLTYDSIKTNVDAVLKRIADAGHDTDKFTAENATYKGLPECCQYDRKEAAETPAP